MNLDKVISEVDERFLSIALDTSLVINHWKSVDFRYVTVQCFVIDKQFTVQQNSVDSIDSVYKEVRMLLANGTTENNTMLYRTLKHGTDKFCMIRNN